MTNTFIFSFIMGEGQQRGGKVGGVRQARGGTVQHGKCSQYFVITVSGKSALKLCKNFKNSK